MKAQAPVRITVENMDLASLARPILAEFNREFDESVGVYTLKEDYRICSCRIESSKLMRDDEHTARDLTFRIENWRGNRD